MAFNKKNLFVVTVLLTICLVRNSQAFTAECERIKCPAVPPKEMCPYGTGKNGCCYGCALGPGETCMMGHRDCGDGLWCKTRPRAIVMKGGTCVYADTMLSKKK